MQEGTTGAVLQSKARDSREPLQIQMLLGRRVPLVGEELEAWHRQQAAKLEAAEPVGDAEMQEPGTSTSLTKRAISELQTKWVVEPRPWNMLMSTGRCCQEPRGRL